MRGHSELIVGIAYVAIVLYLPYGIVETRWGRVAQRAEGPLSRLVGSASESRGTDSTGAPEL